ncbi:TPA: hypothetical protein ACSTLU_005331 [Serratia fonticola]
MKKIIFLVVFFLLALSIFIFNKITVFSVQPIGALPDGITIVMWRKNDMRLFDSPDGICLRRVGHVSILCRSQAMIESVDKDNIIMRLDFIEQAYLLSTDGKKFER